MLLNSQEVTEEIKMGIKKYLETNESKKTNKKKDNTKSLGCSKCNAKREFYMNMSLSQETREAAS